RSYLYADNPSSQKMLSSFDRSGLRQIAKNGKIWHARCYPGGAAYDAFCFVSAAVPAPGPRETRSADIRYDKPEAPKDRYVANFACRTPSCQSRASIRTRGSVYTIADLCAPPGQQQR